MKMEAGHFNFDIKPLAPRYIQNHQAHRASQGRESQSSKNIQLVLSTILASFVELSSLCDGLMGLMHFVFVGLEYTQIILHSSPMGEYSLGSCIQALNLIRLNKGMACSPVVARIMTSLL